MSNLLVLQKRLCLGKLIAIRRMVARGSSVSEHPIKGPLKTSRTITVPCRLRGFKEIPNWVPILPGDINLLDSGCHILQTGFTVA